METLATGYANFVVEESDYKEKRIGKKPIVFVEQLFEMDYAPDTHSMADAIIILGDDSRYKLNECERKWATFGCDGCLNWDDIIEYDDDGVTYEVSQPLSPVEQLILYLETLFKQDKLVGYVTNDVWQDSNGRWMPYKGVSDRTAGELISTLKKHPNDLGAIGDWNKECGVWIRFNQLDGHGAKNENITRFTHVLVESDEMPISKQDAMYMKLDSFDFTGDRCHRWSDLLLLHPLDHPSHKRSGRHHHWRSIGIDATGTNQIVNN